MANAPRITLLTRIALPIQTVFDLWTQPRHIGHWWGGASGTVVQASIEAKAGRGFWIAVALNDGRGYDNFGTFTLVIPGDVLGVDWEHGDRPPSKLVVQLLELGGITELSLVHREFPDERRRDVQLERWRDALAAFELYAARLRP